MLEDIQKKAMDDELNKAHDEIAPQIESADTLERELYSLRKKRDSLSREAERTSDENRREDIHNMIVDIESEMELVRDEIRLRIVCPDADLQKKQV